MGQDIFDLITVLVLVFFAARGYLRGFIGEVSGIASLAGGLWAAHVWHARLAERLTTAIQDPSWRTIAAYALIFFAVILFVAILSRALQKIISFSFVAPADKAAGCLLGLVKGVILCALLLLVLQKFFYDAPFMQYSRAMQYFNIVIEQVRTLLPQDVLVKAGL
ncbi:MAG: colicin V production family protein [Candidatus Desulfovibrio kirbyi]|uniref:Colicin V production family protein n=1 Tax=Candidatus Desulfovibrio kirbyi TaxID=2696086 RepID=A0A6L2R4J9_9BACT|nr:CvpA family protein [Desulfovibrio sp.]GFH62491.1 MAG: colicin V production family protein [Candidatus Desulfovibrio kirbyi]